MPILRLRCGSEWDQTSPRAWIEMTAYLTKPRSFFLCQIKSGSYSVWDKQTSLQFYIWPFWYIETTFLFWFFSHGWKSFWHNRLGEACYYQNRWIFGNLQTALTPPPPSFSENHIAEGQVNVCAFWYNFIILMFKKIYVDCIVLYCIVLHC